jgi:hypothetical protein
MFSVNYYELVLSTYHDTPQCSVRFTNASGAIEQSALYRPAEMTNILHLWRMGELLGSFAIGTQLAPGATFILCEV